MVADGYDDLCLWLEGARVDSETGRKNVQAMLELSGAGPGVEEDPNYQRASQYENKKLGFVSDRATGVGGG